MSDSPSDETEESEAARMELEPDAFHEGEDEAYLDCPQCGSPATLSQIINEGRCSGYLDSEVAESEAEDQQLQDPVCTAELALELVWES